MSHPPTSRPIATGAAPEQPGEEGLAMFGSASGPWAVLFEDGRGKTAPLTDLRPCFEVRTGAVKTRERLARALGVSFAGCFVPARLEDVAREMAGLGRVNDTGMIGGDTLFVNCRCVLPHRAISALGPGEWLVEEGSGDVVAARLDGAAGRAFVERGFTAPAGAGGTARSIAAPALLSRPWHVRTFRDRALDLDLQHMEDDRERGVRPPHSVHFGVSLLTVHPTAKIYPGVVLDCEAGPIVIDEGVTVRPGVSLVGPCYLGPNVTILDRAIIKAHTAVGPWCTLAGEVGGTIFQGFANKAHDGHLGDSWVGEWANLGAGTTNSNLLNTYGEVVGRADPKGSNERTGLQFLGCVIGDHVKTAICTRIMTGAVVHTGAMWAAGRAVGGCIAPFAWVTDEGEKRYRLEKFLEIARTVMGRRKVQLSAALSAAISDLHAGTAG
ncbi:MAG: putative sugar nucleotidyl transferase [Phycisphaerales bacterium]